MNFSSKIGRWMGAAVVVLGAVGLAGCGEKPQQADAGTKKVDSHASSGAAAKFTANGWTAGDRASWERQIKERNQRQNEYVRIR